MGVDYYFEAFMYEVLEENVIRMTIVDDDELMYHLCFTTVQECQNYQKVLHKLDRELTTKSIVRQAGFLSAFINDNPFNFPYKLLKAHEWFNQKRDLP